MLRGLGPVACCGGYSWRSLVLCFGTDNFILGLSFVWPMRLVEYISDRNLGLEVQFCHDNISEFRISSRAVLFDDDMRVALMYNAKQDYHKLPGGGFEAGESPKMCLERELLEETGCSVELDMEIGLFYETRLKDSFAQFSYAFIGHVVRDMHRLSLTTLEKDFCFRLSWVDSGHTLDVLERDSPQTYSGKFIHYRDLCILRRASNLLGLDRL